VGSWQVVVGHADQVVHLWELKEGYSTSDRLLEAQMGDKDVRASMAEQSKLCSKRINAVLLRFSYWDAPAPRPPKHIYELRSYILKPGTMIEWGSHWARGINYRKTDDQAVGGFFSQIGRLYMVFHFWAYKDLEARKRIREDTWQKPGWDVNVTYTVPLIKRMRSRIMIPTSFSPMQ